MSSAAFDRPSPARIYDFLTGGPNHFPVDRALAARLADPAQGGYAGIRQLATANRAFVLAATRWAVSILGISQFLDAGCGLPSSPAIHEAAMSAALEAALPLQVRVAYVDRDPSAARFMAASVLGLDGFTAFEGDTADPAGVLAAPAFTAQSPVIDLARPVCVIFGAVLSALDADTARDAVKGFTSALTPGSCVVISCASFGDEEHAARMSGLFRAAGPWYGHDAETVASFFGAGDLRIVHGRVMDVAAWPVREVSEGTAATGAAVLGGIGVKD